MTDLETDEMIYPWMYQPDEPPLWYDRFSKYFLPLGPGRTLLKAFLSYLSVEEPRRFAKYQTERRHSAEPGWSKAAGDYQWRERADQYDAFTYSEALFIVEMAKRKLLESSEKAVDALVTALAEGRLKVSAAKEILDRAGLPSTSKHDISVSPYSADEFAKASQEVTEWEKKIRAEQSG